MPHAIAQFGSDFVSVEISKETFKSLRDVSIYCRKRHEDITREAFEDATISGDCPSENCIIKYLNRLIAENKMK